MIDIVSLIENELGKKAIINYKPLQPGDITQTHADIKHSIDKIDYYPKTEIRAGIHKLITWYKEYYNV